MYFWAILRVVVFSYPVEGQVFPKHRQNFASHHIAFLCLAHVATHIASLPASRDMGHSVCNPGNPREARVLSKTYA